MTIGGYGYTEERFLSALKAAGVDTFLDVRQRRGMRGAKYAFLNSLRLQTLLSSIGISYVHALELAPTAAVRNVQKLEDQASETSKRDRLHLSPMFVQKYNSDILANLNPSRLENCFARSKVLALFCVEREHTACHRSLAAQHLARLSVNVERVEHLSP